MVQVSNALTMPIALLWLTPKGFDMRHEAAHQMTGREKAGRKMHIQINEGIRSMLIVEDEGIVAMMMEELLRDMGVRQIHSCPDTGAALKLLETVAFDCAVLDLRVRDGSSTPVADALAARGVPFVFSTGSDSGALEERHRHRPLLTKPFADDDFKLIVLDAWTLGRGISRPLNGGAEGLRAPFQTTRQAPDVGV
jgi:CheY-like chemotaxis protein